MRMKTRKKEEGWILNNHFPVHFRSHLLPVQRSQECSLVASFSSESYRETSAGE